MSYGQQPPPYGSPTPYGYGGYPAEHPQGTTILILGILSLVVCSPLGIAAWVMGNKAMREIDSSGQQYTNRGNVKAGQICGIIGTVIFGLSMIFLVLYVIALIAFVGTASTY